MGPRKGKKYDEMKNEHTMKMTSEAAIFGKVGDQKLLFFGKVEGHERKQIRMRQPS